MYPVTDLDTFLSSRYPAVWVETVDYYRAIETIIEAHLRSGVDKTLYSINVLDGLVAYIDDKWKPVLMWSDRDETFMKIFNIQVMLNEVLKNNGIFLIPGGEPASKSEGFILHSVGVWRNNVLSDRGDDYPQFIIAGKMKKDEMDPLVASAMFSINLASMDTGSIEDFYTRLGASYPELFEPDSMEPLVRHTSGFNEHQTMATVLKSTAETNKVQPEFVETERRKIIGAAGILEVLKPTLKIDDIGGLESAKQILTGNVWLHQNPDEASKLGLRAQNRMLLIGVPGTGKSALCEATADLLGFDMVKFGVSKMMNKFIGQSEENMRAAFAQMNAMTPIMVWIDELGRDLSGSHSSNDGGTTDRVHGELLTGLQELDPRIILMAAANRVDGLPPEMLRADRFDRILFVGFPSEVERKAILRIYLGADVPDATIDSLVRVTESFTGAEIKAAINDVRFKIGTSERRAPTAQEIGLAFRGFRNRVWLRRRDEIVQMYRIADNEWDWASDDQLTDAKAYMDGKTPSEVSTSVRKVTI